MSSDTNLNGSAEEVFVSQISLTLARCRSSGNLASFVQPGIASAVLGSEVPLVICLWSNVIYECLEEKRVWR